MRVPAIIQAHTLGAVHQHWPHARLPDGTLTPARPEPPPSGMFGRFRVAWGVFTGRYDALKWHRQ